MREGTGLLLTDNTLTLQGEKGGFVFTGEEKRPVAAGESLTQLLG